MEFCVFTEPQQGADYETMLRQAQHAERLGFDGWFRSDHYLVMGDGDGLPGPTDAWTTLAGLARETSRIRLGTLVSSMTFRHPGILAIQVAQVDAMSGGRVELGLGTGWFAQEHAAYGIPFPTKRFGMLEEQLAIVTGLWRTPVGERFAFDGAHYALSDSPALPKPVQSPVPLIVGGGGPKRTPQLAARYATEFNIGFVGEDRRFATPSRTCTACAARRVATRSRSRSRSRCRRSSRRRPPSSSTAVPQRASTRAARARRPRRACSSAPPSRWSRSCSASPTSAPVASTCSAWT